MMDDVFAPDFGVFSLGQEPQPLKNNEPAGLVACLDLKQWRVSKGLSQFQAAVALNVSLSTWIRWETKSVPALRQARVREMLK